MSFFILGARRRWVVNYMTLLLYAQEKIPISVLQETGWAPGLLSTGAEKSSRGGIRSLYRSARSNFLYRLSYAEPYPPLHTFHSDLL